MGTCEILFKISAIYRAEKKKGAHEGLLSIAALDQRRFATGDGLNEEVGAGARIGFTVAVLAAAWGTNALVAGAGAATVAGALATGA